MGSFWCKQTIRITDSQGSAPTITDKPFALIGAHPKCDIQIKAENILSVHYYLHATDEGVFCLSLTEDRTHHGWLAPNQPIVCGDIEVFASLVTPDTQITADELPALDEPNSLSSMLPVVTLHREGEELAMRRLTAPLTILGRTRPSVLRIRSDTVSRVHCVLYFAAGILWTIDLHSTNRVFFEGRPHAVVALKLGEAVDVEPIRLTFREITSGIGSGIQPSNTPDQIPAPRRPVAAQVEAQTNQASAPGTLQSLAHSPLTSGKTRSVPSQVIVNEGMREETAADAVFANLDAGEAAAAPAVIAHLQSRIQDLEKRVRHTTTQLSAKQALIHDTADVLQASREATKNFGQRVSQLEQNVASKQSALESAQKEIRERDAEIKKLQEQLGEIESHRLNEEKLQTRILELEAGLQVSANEGSAAKQLQETQANELRDQTAKLQNAQEELQQLSALFEKTNREHAVLSEESLQAKKSLQTQLTNAEVKLTQATSAREKHQQLEQEQLAKIDQLTTELTNKTALHKEIQEQLAAANNAHAREKLNNEALQSTVESFQQQLSQQEAKNLTADEQTQQIKQREAKLRQQELEVTKLKSSQQELIAKLQTAQDSLQFRDEELSESKTLADQLQQQLTALEEYNVDQENQNADLDTQLQRRNTEIQEQKQQLTKLNSSQKDLQAKLQAAQHSVEVREQELSQSKILAEQLQQQLTALEKDNVDQENQNADLDTQLQRRNAKLQEQEQQLTKLNSSQKDLQAKLQAAQHSVELREQELSQSKILAEQLQQQLTAREEDNVAQANRNTALQTQLQQRDTQLAQLSAQALDSNQQSEEAQNHLQLAEQELQTKIQKIKEQQAHIRKLDAELKSTQSTHVAIESKTQTLEKEVSIRNDSISRLEKQLTEGEQLYQTLQQSLQISEEEVERLYQVQANSRTATEELQEKLVNLETDNRKQADSIKTHIQQLEKRTNTITELRKQISTDTQQRESLQEQLNKTNQRHTALQQEHHAQQQRVKHLEKQISTLEDNCVTEAINAEASDVRLQNVESTRHELEQKLTTELEQRLAVTAELQVATNKVAQLMRTREETETTLAALRKKVAQTETDAAAKSTQDNLRHRQQLEQKDARITDLEERLASRNQVRQSATSSTPHGNSYKQVNKQQREASVPSSLSNIQQMVATPTHEDLPSPKTAISVERSQKPMHPATQQLLVGQPMAPSIEDETQEVRAFAQKRRKGVLPLVYKSSMIFLWLLALGLGGSMVFSFVRAIIAAAGE